MAGSSLLKDPGRLESHISQLGRSAILLKEQISHSQVSVLLALLTSSGEESICLSILLLIIQNLGLFPACKPRALLKYELQDTILQARKWMYLRCAQAVSQANKVWTHHQLDSAAHKISQINRQRSPSFEEVLDTVILFDNRVPEFFHIGAAGSKVCVEVD